MATIPLSQVLNPEFEAFRTTTAYATDYANRPQTNSFFGDTITAMRADSVSALFHYNISGRSATQVVNGTGAISHANSAAMVATGTGIGDAKLSSVQSVHHYPGHESHALFDAIFSTPIADTNMYIGAFNGDGFFIGYQDTTFGIGYRKSNVDTFIPMASFNGDDISALNPQKLNIYRITFAFGGMPVAFEVSLAGENDWKVMHRLDPRGVNDDNITSNPSLPICAFVEKTNASPATEVSITTSAWSAGAATGSGMVDAAHRQNSFKSGIKTIAANTPTNIITVTNPLTWKGLDNHVGSQLLYVSISTDGTKNVNLEFLRNATVGGAPSFTPIDTDASPLEYDLAGTTVSGGSLSWGTTLAKVATSNINTSDYRLILQPGQSTTLTATSTATSDVSVYLMARDLF